MNGYLHDYIENFPLLSLPMSFLKDIILKSFLHQCFQLTDWPCFELNVELVHEEQSWVS